MTEDEIKDKKELLITLGVISAVIIASTLLYFFWSDEPGNNFEPIDRTINFPEDEGMHDETFQRWTIFGALDGNGVNDFEFLIRWANHMDQSEIQLQYILRDKNNLTGVSSYEFEQEGEIEGAYDSLDISFSGGGTSTSMTSTGSFKYDFQTEFGSEIKVELSVESRKNPILYGDDGRIYQPGFGTVFGYYQPNLRLIGTVTINEIETINVEGKGWLDHMWGGEIKAMRSETWHMQLDNSVEIFISKLFNPDTDELYPDDMVLYVANIIRTDGRLLTPDLLTDINMENQDYLKFRETYIPEPVDRFEYLAWSSEWRLYNSDIDLTIKIHGDSPLRTSHLGFLRVEGFYMGQRVTGTGITDLNYVYRSYPDIREVSDNFSILRPLQPVTITADITYIPPIDLEEIYMEYRVNEGNWIRQDMQYDDERWIATIPGQTFGDTIEYRVVVIDMIDHEISTKIEAYFIDFV